MRRKGPEGWSVSTSFLPSELVVYITERTEKKEKRKGASRGRGARGEPAYQAVGSVVTSCWLHDLRRLSWILEMAFFFGGFSWWFCPGETAHELAERTWLLSVVECVCRWCWDASPFPGVWVGKPPLRIRCDGSGRERERGCT